MPRAASLHDSDYARVLSFSRMKICHESVNFPLWTSFDSGAVSCVRFHCGQRLRIGAQTRTWPGSRIAGPRPGCQGRAPSSTPMSASSHVCLRASQPHPARCLLLHARAGQATAGTRRPTTRVLIARSSTLRARPPLGTRANHRSTRRISAWFTSSQAPSMR